MKLSVLERLEKTAAQFRDKTVYSDAVTSITFGEIEEKAKRLGSALAERVRPGSPVAVMGKRGVLTPVMFLGAVYAGCYYIPLDASQPESRLRDILSVLKPAILISDADTISAAGKLGFEGGIVPADELFAHEISQERLDEISGAACLDDPLYVIFTSGSTGRPKGVITSMLSLMNYIDAYIEVMGITEADVLGNQSPLDYIAAIRDIYIPLFTGASMFIIPKECFVMPSELFKALNEHKVTSVGWSVSVFTIAAKMGVFDEAKPQYLKKICFSGSVMPCSILRIWQENLPDAKFVNQYGPTECTASCTYYEVKGMVEDGDVLPIGVPYRNYRVFLLKEDNTPAKAGEMGEICVAGQSLALGYYNDPELTAKSFIQNPLNSSYRELIYKTGDYGVLLPDGNLGYKGRKDRQIKHLGHRVELSEIEAAALRLESVSEAIARNLVTGELERFGAHAVVIASGGYGNVFFLSTNAMASNGSAAFQCYRKGAGFANPCFTQIHPTCIPVHGDQQSKLTLMSESLRNDGRIWVPKKIEDVKALRSGAKKPSDIAEEDRDYYLERRYPAFGNLVPRDVASRAAKERCDAGFGVNETGLAVFLDFKTAIERLGKDVIKQRYGNLFDMYEEITDVNPYEQPMQIFPAVHYTMGGIWVDYNLMTTIPGLYAIGEANFSDHGANRLGASALMQGLADGYFVLPYTIGDYLSHKIQAPKVKTDTKAFDEAEKGVKDKISKLLSINGKQSVDDIHKKLGHIMWENVGMARSKESLEKAIVEIQALRKEFWKDVKVVGKANEFNVELEKALRLADFLELGELMARDALNREESCGGHFRVEHQTEEGEAKRDDEHFVYAAVWEYKGENEAPELTKEPLNFEFVHPAQRNYKD